MYTRVGLMLVSVLASGCWALAATVQEKSVPTEEERVVLNTPEVIALELAPPTRRRSAGVYTKDSGPFKFGSKIAFEIMASNTSIFSLVVYGWDTHNQNYYSGLFSYVRNRTEAYNKIRVDNTVIMLVVPVVFLTSPGDTGGDDLSSLDRKEFPPENSPRGGKVCPAARSKGVS